MQIKVKLVWKNNSNFDWSSFILNHIDDAFQAHLCLLSSHIHLCNCCLCSESYYGESIRHLDIRSGEHISVSPLTGKKVKPIHNSAARDNLLHCTYLPYFDNSSILAHENKKFLLKIKENLLIMRDKPSLDRNTSSATLYLFHKVS